MHRARSPTRVSIRRFLLVSAHHSRIARPQTDAAGPTPSGKSTARQPNARPGFIPGFGQWGLKNYVSHPTPRESLYFNFLGAR
jgi:hypothetical protein